jgi:hypothetical protein
MFGSSKAPAGVATILADLEAKREYQEQKSRDMLARAKTAMREGRRDMARSYAVQKNTHDAASAQYSSLICTLAQQQTVADISAAHRQIAGVLKSLKSEDMGATIDNALDVADAVSATQSELGQIGGALFQGSSDTESFLDSLLDDPPKATPDVSGAEAIKEEDLGLPEIPNEPITSSIPESSLFSSLLVAKPTTDDPKFF